MIHTCDNDIEKNIADDLVESEIYEAVHAVFYSAMLLCVGFLFGQIYSFIK